MTNEITRLSKQIAKRDQVITYLVGKLQELAAPSADKGSRPLTYPPHPIREFNPAEHSDPEARIPAGYRARRPAGTRGPSARNVFMRPPEAGKARYRPWSQVLALLIALAWGSPAFAFMTPAKGIVSQPPSLWFVMGVACAMVFGAVAVWQSVQIARGLRRLRSS
jgi:hypothetical protein